MTVETQFESIGARAKVRPLRAPTRRWDARLIATPLTQALSRSTNFPRIDIRHDRKGEYFDLAVPEGVEMEVIDTDKDARHLLLMARLDARNDKARYLCGHDERHWFVAAVPESYPASTVQEAKVALQPPALRDMTAVLPRAKRIARHNEVYRRQGEWFFVPDPDFAPAPHDFILQSEPLRRDGRSKPHVVAEAVRSGGERRWLPQRTNARPMSPARREEINARLGSMAATTDADKARLEVEFPEVNWSPVLVNPTMYVRGTVRHSDHATVVLRGWHRVVMNAEQLARASSHIAFID